MAAFTAPQILTAARSVVARGYANQAYLCDVATALGTTVSALAGTLNDLHRKGEITLCRADLVGAMDAGKVAASEIHHPMLASATFHFVIAA